MEMYPFQLVHFLGEVPQVDGAQVDCVPLIWLDYDVERSVCLAKFMPPPYTKATSTILNSMIKDEQNPDPDWPVYPVEIRGQAKTYSEAMLRLNVLKTQKYAYTSDSDLNHEDKSKKLTKIFSLRKIKENTERVKDLMQVPTISSASESESATQYSGPSYSSDETSESNTKKNGGKKKSRLQINREPLSDISTRNKPRIINTKSYTESSARKRLNYNTDLPIPKKPKSADSSKTMPRQINKEQYNRSSIPKKSTQLSQCDPSDSPCYTNENEHNFHYDNKVSSCHSEARPMSSYRPIHTRSSTPSSSRRDDSADLLHRTPKSTPSACSSKLIFNKSKKLKPLHSPEMEINGLSEDETMQLSTPSCRNSNRSNDSSLHNDIKGIKLDVQSIKNDIVTIKNILNDVLRKVPGIKNPSFQKTYNLNLPLPSLNDLESFNTNLTNNEEFRKDFVLSLIFMIDSTTSLARNIACILKKFLSRAVALEFTACKATAGKTILKGTPFCDCLIDAFKAKSENDPVCNVSEKLFFEKLGQVLGNARDWDGRRGHRKTIQPEEDDE